MAKFIVGVRITIGEYEKRAIHLIEAETRSQAMLQALADESHGNARLDEDGVWWDLGGEMEYKATGCDVLPDDKYEVIKGLGIAYLSYYDPELIQDMIDDDEEKDIDTLLSYL